MATPKQKVERALYGPSILEVTLGAAVSLALGALLATGYLVAKPVERVRALPKEIAANTVYYVEGSRDANKGKQWMRKRQMLSEGQSAEIALTEDELNAWVASGSKPEASGGAPGGFFRPEALNFRVRDGLLQIGVPSSFEVYGFVLPVILQARGVFEKQGDQFVFVTREMMIGSLPAHRLPGVADFVRGRLLASHHLPGEVGASWKRLSNVRIDGDTLRLTVP